MYLVYAECVCWRSHAWRPHIPHSLGGLSVLTSSVATLREAFKCNLCGRSSPARLEGTQRRLVMKPTPTLRLQGLTVAWWVAHVRRLRQKAEREKCAVDKLIDEAVDSALLVRSAARFRGLLRVAVEVCDAAPASWAFCKSAS